MVRNVKTLDKEYSTRKIKQVIVDPEDSDSMDQRSTALKEKNRQSAQKSRDNKKKYIINLELRIAEMESENQELKHLLAQSEHKYQMLEAKLRERHTFASATTVPEQEEICQVDDSKDASDETGSGKDSFERLSARSFMSCGNFLMLALVAMCCIFGVLDSGHQIGLPRALYSLQSIEHVMQRQNSVECPEIYYGHNPHSYINNCSTSASDTSQKDQLNNPLDQKVRTKESLQATLTI